MPGYLHEKKVHSTEPLPPDWGRVAQELVTTAAADVLAQLRSRASTQRQFDIKLDVTVHFGGPITVTSDAGDAGAPQCVCVFTRYPDGGTSCICTGPGAASCDCAGEPVA